MQRAPRSPTYSLGSEYSYDYGPGPYSPEIMESVDGRRSPDCSINIPVRKFGIPNPSKYSVQSARGRQIPNLPPSAADTFFETHDMQGNEITPGPDKYSGIRTDIYKNKSPQYTMRTRFGPEDKPRSPGPAAYLPKIRDPIPGGIFGRRVKALPFITPEDRMQSR